MLYNYNYVDVASYSGSALGEEPGYEANALYGHQIDDK